MVSCRATFVPVMKRRPRTSACSLRSAGNRWRNQNTLLLKGNNSGKFFIAPTVLGSATRTGYCLHYGQNAAANLISGRWLRRGPQVDQRTLAIPAGLEPATYSLGNCRSIQLSYGTGPVRSRRLITEAAGGNSCRRPSGRRLHELAGEHDGAGGGACGGAAHGFDADGERGVHEEVHLRTRLHGHHLHFAGLVDQA